MDGIIFVLPVDSVQISLLQVFVMETMQLTDQQLPHVIGLAHNVEILPVQTPQLLIILILNVIPSYPDV